MLESTLVRNADKMGAILEAAAQIEGIAVEIDDVLDSVEPKVHFELSHSLGIYSLYLDRLHARNRTDVRQRLEELAIQGTGAYQEIVPVAHALYASWPKPKQVRAERGLRSTMTTNRVVEIRTGLVEQGCVSPMSYLELFGAAHALQALVNENRNPNQTDPYWERIRDAVVIEPRPGYVIPINLHKEDGFGNWDWYYWFDECFRTSSDDGTPSGIESLIGSLVGEKVIFFPISTKEESVAFRNACYANAELPFVVEVKKLNGDLEGMTYETIGMVKAEEFNPFARTDASYVTQFLCNTMGNRAV